MIAPFDIRVAVEYRWNSVVRAAIQSAYVAAGGALGSEPNQRPGNLWFNRAYELSTPPYGVFSVRQDGRARKTAGLSAYAATFAVNFGVYADQNLPPVVGSAALAAMDMAVWTPAALTLRNGTVLYVGFGEADESFEPTLRNGNDVCVTKFGLSLLCEGSTATA